MTLLTKIRNKSGLLVTIIAIALVVFILESALESRKGLANADRSKIAVINGKDVSADEFQSKLDQAETNEKNRTQKATIDENQRNSLRQQVWNQILLEYVVQPRYSKIGLGVSTDELFDMVQGKDPHPQIKQAFVDEKTKQFSPQNVVNFLKNMEKDETGDTKSRWLIFEAAVKEERIAQKYTALVKKGLYVTKAEAKRNYEGTGKTASFQFVFQNYASVPDSTIKVGDDEMRKYYNENKNKYNQKETARAIDYVEYDVIPSTEDRATTEKGLATIKTEFMTAAVDSDFVNQNADTRYTDKYIAKGQFLFYDSLSKSPVGTVIGPYFEGNSYKLVKLSGSKMAPDSVKARHILISIEGGDIAKAKVRADSLKNAIKGGKKFEDLARIFSKDPGSGAKGGDLGWFKEGMMVKPFNDACFYGKKGEIQIVESQFGIHIIEVMDKGKESPRLLIATVDRTLTPSSQTYQTFYAKASEFAGKNNSKELFEKTAKEQSLNKRSADNIKEIDRNINGVDNTRDVVRWMYGAKKDEVSPVFQLGDKYMVAILTMIKEKGTLPFEDVKTQVEKEAIKQKKAETFIASMESALKGGSLEQMANKLKLSVENADNQNFISGSVGAYGRESSVLGKVFGMKLNATSAPIKGDAGVFVVKVTSVTEPAKSPDDYKSNMSSLSNTARQRVDYEIFEALKEKADIQDNRAVFF